RSGRGGQTPRRRRQGRHRRNLDRRYVFGWSSLDCRRKHGGAAATIGRRSRAYDGVAAGADVSLVDPACDGGLAFPNASPPAWAGGPCAGLLRLPAVRATAFMHLAAFLGGGVDLDRRTWGDHPDIDVDREPKRGDLLFDR